MPASPATPRALLRAVLQAGAEALRARLGAAAQALLLALLLRLLARTDAAWDLEPEEWDEADESPRAWIILPTMGRAPHAACIEAGLVPDWILPGIRNRGMRPLAAHPRPRIITRPARAPPRHPTSCPDPLPPGSGNARP
jgi:hypothetical protein